jgi:antitoxin MazE
MGQQRIVRIPASVMAAAAMRIDQAADVREEGGRIIIEPIAVPSYDLAQLLVGMSPGTFPGMVDFGPEVGGEAW